MNSGAVAIAPSVQTVYNVSGDPDLRYSVPYFVNQLKLPDTIIGDQGTAVFSQSDRISLSFYGDLILGRNSGSSGTLNIDGPPNSNYNFNLFSYNSILMGQFGSGRMTIQNGGIALHEDIISVDRNGNLYEQAKVILGSEPGTTGFLSVRGAGAAFKRLDTIEQNSYAYGLVLGRKGEGNLNVEAGAIVTTRAARLASSTGGAGHAIVTGTGSRWDIDAQLWVGEKGSGSLEIRDGGVVKNGFGDFALGTLYDIDSPDDLGALDFGAIGHNPNAQGSVLVDGANSTWETSWSPIIGSGGYGTLTLDHGARVISNDRLTPPPVGTYFHTLATLGYYQGATGIVTISGNSRWSHGSDIVIGDKGTGKLTLASGGAVDVGENGSLILGKVGSGELIFGGAANLAPGSVQGGYVSGGAGGSTVRFQHNGAAFTTPLNFYQVKQLESTGPGKTTLTGWLNEVASIKADAGTLELTNVAYPLAAGKLTVNGGNVVLNGSDLSLPPPNTSFSPFVTVLKGSLSLINGGKLSSTTLISGEGGAASVVVDGAGSTLTLLGTSAQPSFVVGSRGNGSLTVSNGGSVSVGDNGQGTLTLGAQPSGEGYLRLGSGGAPGVLYASKITQGDEGYGRIIFKHNIGYSFSPLIEGASVEAAAGSTGATGLTASSDLTNLQLINGKILVVAGAKVHTDSTDIGYIGGTGSTPSGSAPILSVEGSGAKLDCDRDVTVGLDVSSAELQLTNGGIVEVARGTGKVVLAGGSATGGGVTFGIGSFTLPGTLLAAAIEGQGSNTDSKVIFNHGVANYSFAPKLTGTLSVFHSGDGSTVFLGTHDYTGTTTINSGTLFVNGSITGSSDVNVYSTLGGTGFLVGIVYLRNGGVISPGYNSVGTLRIRNLRIDGGGHLKYQIGPNLASDHILLSASTGYGPSTLFPGTDGAITFDLIPTGTIQAGSYNLMSRAQLFSSDFISRLQFTAAGRTGVQGYFQDRFVSGSGTSHHRLEFVMTSAGQSDYDAWCAQNGLNPLTNGAPTQDPDRDGVSNMMEFVLRSSPNSGKQEFLPTVKLTTNGSLYFSFTKRYGSDALFTTTVQYSTNLRDWTDADPSMISTTTFTGLYTLVNATIPHTPGLPIFARLKVAPATL